MGVDAGLNAEPEAIHQRADQAVANPVPQYLALLREGRQQEARQLVASESERAPNTFSSLLLASWEAGIGGDLTQRIRLSRRAEEVAADVNQRISAVAMRFDAFIALSRLGEAEAELEHLAHIPGADYATACCRISLLQANWQMDDAYAAAKSLHAAFPHDPAALVLWGWAQSHKRECQEALDTFKEVVALATDHADPNVLQAQSLTAETKSFIGQWDDALRLLGQLNEAHPFDLSVLVMRASLLLRRHRYDEVIALADRVLSVSRESTVGFQLKALALLRSRRIAEARATITQGLAVSQKSPSLRVDLAWCHVLEHDLDTAFDRFTEVALEQSDNPTAQIGLGAVAFQRHELDQALEAFAAAAKVGEIDPAPAANRVLVLAAQGRDDEAKLICEELEQVDGENTQVLQCLCGIAYRGNEIGRARTYARRAYAADPLDLSCEATLGAIESASGAYEGARALLTSVIAAGPLNAPAHLELGVLEQKEGSTAQARLRLRRAIEIDSQLVDAYVALARVEEADDRFGAAETALRAGIQATAGNDDARLLASLGHILRRLGEQSGSATRLDEAELVLSRARELRPQNASALFDLGVVRFRQGDHGGATEIFEALLRIRPQDPSAQGMLGRIRLTAIPQRHVALWQLSLAGVAVLESIVAWTALLAGKISGATLGALLTLFLGLILVAALLPKLQKVKLGGLEAELTAVTYHDDSPTALGPTMQSPMTVSASAGASIWFGM
jgi:tetratricopeptide (TPR) repeat protein